MAAALLATPSPAPSRHSHASRRTPSTVSHARSRTSRVMGGRIEKSPRKKPNPAEKHAQGLADKLRKDERQAELKRFESMKAEQELYPNSKHWHPHEAKLFELLYMRGVSPLFPSHWGIDFMSIPVPDILFQTSESDQPVVYSHSGKDYRGERKCGPTSDVAGANCWQRPRRCSR